MTAGTSGMPSLRAARTSPQPATTRLSPSTKIGRTKPNRSRLSFSLRTWAGGCLRVSRPNGFRTLYANKAWTEIAGDGIAVGAPALEDGSIHDEEEIPLGFSVDLTPERRSSGGHVPDATSALVRLNLRDLVERADCCDRIV